MIKIKEEIKNHNPNEDFGPIDENGIKIEFYPVIYYNIIIGIRKI